MKFTDIPFLPPNVDGMENSLLGDMRQSGLSVSKVITRVASRFDSPSQKCTLSGWKVKEMKIIHLDTLSTSIPATHDLFYVRR